MAAATQACWNDEVWIVNRANSAVLLLSGVSGAGGGVGGECGNPLPGHPEIWAPQ